MGLGEIELDADVDEGATGVSEAISGHTQVGYRGSRVASGQGYSTSGLFREGGDGGDLAGPRHRREQPGRVRCCVEVVEREFALDEQGHERSASRDVANELGDGAPIHYDRRQER